MEDNGDLMKHMNEFDGIIDQLKKVDVKVEEEEKALLFLASLPDSYEVFVESLICGMDTITLEQAQPTLMSREARKKSKEGDRDPNGLALVIEANRRKSTGKGSKGGKFRSNNVQCFKCKRYGHIKRDCPTKRDESNENKSECAFVAEGDDCDVLTISENMDANSNWYLDSASATHICYQKDCFDLLQEGVAGNLTLGNKSIVKVMGLGVVKIKMFDGVVHSLGGVTYVPKMRKNLVSLSLLDSKRYGYSACDGVIKVTQGDMVLMRGNLHNSLYHLECEASKGWEQCTGDCSYQSEISIAEEVMKDSHGIDDGERMKNLASSELEGSSRWSESGLGECSWEVIEEECARDLGLVLGTIKVNLLYFKFSIIEEQFHSVDVGKRPNHYFQFSSQSVNNRLKILLQKKLKELPRDTRQLISLEYLNIDQCNGLQCLPKGLGELTSLQTLSRFIVNSFSTAATLNELRDLDDLGNYLSIENLDDVKNVELESMEANLKTKKRLQSLKLDWWTYPRII
ncbi:zinc finger protein [Theobroma cacao]|nr:zinc finger protein [Theobroma cacao]